MKIVLLKDVPKIGKKHEVKEINDGYARNFLIPKNLAAEASPAKLKEVDELKKKIALEKNMQAEAIRKSLKAIDGLELMMKGKAGETGHLFSAIHKKEILEKMQKDYGAAIGEEFLLLEKPIKEIGETELTVSAGGQKASFKVIVEKI